MSLNVFRLTTTPFGVLTNGYTNNVLPEGSSTLTQLQQSLVHVSNWQGTVPQWGDFANYSPHLLDSLAMPDLVGLDAIIGPKVWSLIA
jgi:uncharacterized protein YqcC (DUF446 family)